MHSEKTPTSLPHHSQALFAFGLQHHLRLSVVEPLPEDVRLVLGNFAVQTDSGMRALGGRLALAHAQIGPYNDHLLVVASSVVTERLRRKTKI